MTEVTLKIKHPEDLKLLVLLAERLKIPYSIIENKEKKSQPIKK